MIDSDAARKELGIEKYIPREEEELYKEILIEAQRKFSIPAAPAMPVVPLSASNGAAPAMNAFIRPHEDHTACAGYVSDKWLAMVHTQVPMKEAMRIPKAKEAEPGA